MSVPSEERKRSANDQTDAFDPKRKSRRLHSKLSIRCVMGCCNNFYNLITLMRPTINGCRYLLLG